MPRIDLSLPHPLPERLRRTADLRGDGPHCLPLRGVLAPVLEEHPHGPLPNIEAALFYNLIESAKPAGIEPSVHLREATRRAIQTPGTDIELCPAANQTE